MTLNYSLLPIAYNVNFSRLFVFDALLSIFKIRYMGSVIGNSYGAGADPIWLDDVDCTGAEIGMQNCAHRPWGQHNCSHNDDVSIRCGESL